jgi:hypothetical protein
MHVKPIARLVVLCFATGCVQMMFSCPAYSQAWVPEKGEGSVTLTYQNLVGYDHFDFTGARQNVGTDRAHSTSLEFEYGVTDKLAFNADVVYVASKYNGELPEGPFDFDGRYHGAFQDAHFQVRYNVRKNPVVLTPFLSVTVPTHHYETSGHSATGRDFYELLLGINAGKQLTPISPNLYVQGRYSFAILKHFAGLNLNRSNFDSELGWVATRRVTLRLLASWQKTYGGLKAPIEFEEPGSERFEFHDRVLQANYFRLGGGITYSLRRNFDVNVAYGGSVSGLNTLAVGGLAIGFSWRFSRGLDISKFHNGP